MQQSTLRHKIKRQLQYIKQQISKFQLSFEIKNIQSNNFIPYLQSLNKVFDLNNSYGEDYYQFIQKKNLEFVLANNRILMKDVCAKIKQLSLALQNSQLFQYKQINTIDGICKICNQHIQSQSIQQAKNDVQDNGINKLKRMLKKIQQQSNMALFSPDQDKYFFRQLNKVLTKKQQVLSITDNHLQKYLQDIMKNLKQIKYLQDLKDTTFTLPQSINWQNKIKSQINSTLLSSFKGKVPPWIQKTFQYFIKIHTKLIRQLKQSTQTQTDPYIQDQVFQLKKIIQRHKDDLKANKSINQDYIKLIDEKSQKINDLEIQNTVLKDKAFVKQINFNKSNASSVSNSKQFRSLRNSSSKKSNQKQNNEPKKSKFKSMLQSEVNSNELVKKIQNKIQQITEENGHQAQIFGQQTREQYSLTQHVKSHTNLLQPNIKRRKDKKFTDIQYFKKVKSQNKTNNQSFLPAISKAFKDAVQSPDKLKKTSILSSYSQKIALKQQKQRLQRLQLPSYDYKNKGSKSIIEVQQNNEGDISESQINYIEYLSQSQRQIRVKKYKQTVNDVTSQLQNKIQNLDVLKKLKKKNNSLLSLNARWVPSHNATLSQLTKSNMNKLKLAHSQQQDYSERVISDVRQYRVQRVDYMMQTELLYNNMQVNEYKQQQQIRRSPLIRIDNRSIQVQTQQSRLQILKRFENNNNLSLISDEHLQKLLSKLLYRGNNNIANNNSSQNKNIKDNNNKCIDKNKDKQRVKLQQQLLQNNQSKQNIKNTNNNNNKTQQQSTFIRYQRQPAKSMFTQLNNNNNKKQYQNNNNIIKSTRINKHQTHILQSNNHSYYQDNYNHSYHQDNYKYITLSTCLFTKKDFSLFINQSNTYTYQANMKLKYHKSPYTQLTNQQITYLTSVFNLLQLIKHHSLQQYNHILSFIKYPYQTVVNNFSILNIVKQMSLQSFLWYMTRIKYYHTKCFDKQDNNKMICSHIQKFSQKIQSILIQAATLSINNQQFNQRQHSKSIKSTKRQKISPHKQHISPHKQHISPNKQHISPNKNKISPIKQNNQLSHKNVS